MLLCSISKKADIIKSLYFLTMYDVSKVPGIYSYKTDKIKIQIREMYQGDFVINCWFNKLSSKVI